MYADNISIYKLKAQGNKIFKIDKKLMKKIEERKNNPLDNMSCFDIFSSIFDITILQPKN